jgi:AcrR family transcriptional regulator
MAKKTFHHLSEDKKSRFLQVSLSEFADRTYDSASVTGIVKELEIAKGSVYQYFQNKKDLWLFLKTHSEKKRLSYTKECSRSSFSNFWDYYLELHSLYIDFDCDYPVMSRLLHRANYTETNPELTEYISEWKQNSLNVYSKLIQAEILMGGFSQITSEKLVSEYLVGLDMMLSRYLQDAYKKIVISDGELALLKKHVRDELKSDIQSFVMMTRRSV